MSGPTAPDPMRPIPYRIRRVRREMPDTVTLEIEPANGEGISVFSAGQFNMLYAFGVGEVPISISGGPDRDDSLEHTLREVGPVTRALGGLRRGDLLGVRGPYGVPWPLEEAQGRDVLIIAGGIGLAPLRPTVHRLMAQRSRYGQVTLLYGARSPEGVLYGDELGAWRERLHAVEVTVDHAVGDWPGHVGVVTTLVSRAAFDPANTVAMICGPEVMMRFAVMELLEAAVRPENVFLSLERNMKCAIGFCGHCQLGPVFACKDGPVFRYDRIERFLAVREL